MKKVIASSVLATSVLLPTNVLGSTQMSTFAATIQTVAVDQLVGKKALLTADNVNVRKGAGTEFNSITKVHTGQIVSVLASEKNSKGEVWYKVSYNSTEGWIIGDFLKAATAAVKDSATTSGTSYVGTTQKIGKNAANMRSGATTSYKVVATLPAGTSLKVLSAFTNAQKEVWFNVEFNGKKGWVISDLFVLNATAGETATSMKVINQATIHKGATKSYDIVATAKPGTTLLVHQEFVNASKERWVQVTYATGKKGWMLASAFEEASIASKVVIKQSSVYSGATKSYKTVATIAEGTKLLIHQEFTNATKEKWYQVTYSVGKKGWIPADAFESVSSTPDPSEKPPVDDNAHVVIDTNIKVSVPVANMRSGPGIDFNVVTQSKQNDVFLSTEYAIDVNQEKWFKVITSVGEAWLHQSVISIIDNTVETPDYDETGVIKRFNALMYTDSSFNSKVILGLPKNTSFTMINQVISDGTAWINIRTSQGTEGWIPDFEINDDIPTKFGTKTSTVYSAASETSKKVDTINLNTPVRVLRTLNSWVNIETQNEKRGWIQASELSNGSPIQLINGRTEVRNGQNYLVWSKPSKFKLTYTMPSSNVLRIYGNLSQINEIKSKITGVDSMKVEQVTGGTSVLLITFNANYTYTIRDADKELTIKIVPKGLVGKKIIVDAGHGAKDPGAVGPNKTKEKDVTLATAKALKAELEAAGATVLLTRSTDVFLELNERTDIANKSDYDAFISIHADSFNATSKGTTTYYNATVNFNGPKSLALANSIQSDLVKTIGTYNKGVKEQVFYVNRMNELPSVLIELAYISNPTEEAQLASVAFQKNAASGIRKGLEKYFNQ
ncbi:SH3 domain-containing protein [Psychrobacillus sp. NPDC058041]|uniref:SH3 domain-containing protein n=1 Tax=Psychrobacillus sp. NPDC058041 TaxID=3346310 RepID=UPI0036D925AA